MSVTDGRLQKAANQVAQELKARRQKLVLAESCTGGAVAATLTDIPGISEYFCGSAVTYRNETKAEWLRIPRADLENPNIGPVSARVAELMCKGALAGTSEANLAASITGHLGPNSPEGLDGVVYIGVSQAGGTPIVQRRTLTVNGVPPESIRPVRRIVAAAMLLEAILQYFAKQQPAPPAV